MRILVTGASGFVGRALVPRLLAEGLGLRALARRPLAAIPDTLLCADLAAPGDLRPALEGVDAVIHLAARVHQQPDPDPDPLAAHRRVNRDGTRRLAEAAAAAGVRRFIFVSSIKAVVESTLPGRPVSESAAPAPATPYGLAKLEAEQALAAIPGLAWTVLRPPLVHGPGATGNLARLVRLIDRGLPMPLGGVRNRRSLLGLANLVDALVACLRHPAAEGRIFHLADAATVSTPELISRIARLRGRPARLFPVPDRLLRLLGPALHARLAASLEVDDGAIRATLGWRPPVSLDDGLREMLQPASAA